MKIFIKKSTACQVVSTLIMRPPPGTMLLLAAVLLIVSSVQANGKHLVIYIVLESIALSYRTISLDCYTGKSATKKMKIVTSMKRIRTWEDCREKCNTNDWCDFFSFKVSLFCFGRNGEDAINLHQTI